MKHINFEIISKEECLPVQINGTKHCKGCKWQGISACEGKNILKTGRNSKGFEIGEKGIINK